MNRAAPGTLLKPKLLALSVAACFALAAAPLRANPTGPSVVHGSVGFNGLGTSALTITNQAGGNAVINWNGFSIGINELTRFQQFANLAVLNRVTGSDISSILGSLQSDGRVLLINPNGIVFGASARIDVAGMVASSLNFSDQDFLAGRLRFTEVPGAGAVVNNGVIETATGGRVYLVAPTVENNGLIQSPQGAIVLAAGKEVELVDAASPYVTVKVAAAEQAVNIGNLVAEGGRIGMFGALVRNSGVVEAGSAVAGPGGEIRLVAAKDLTLDAGSVVSANGSSGGKVLLQAEGGTNLVGGTVEAKGSPGTGGEVSALGVRVGVVGRGVIDASGDMGGGTVLLGGDYQGNNAAVQNAERTYIGADGVIRADAMTAGDGGRVIAWADGDTRFYGSISANGGSEGGNGGFVETSGKEVLQVSGTVSTAAPSGTGGVWLLDPRDIKIQSTGGGTDDNFLVANGIIPFAGEFGDVGATSTIWVGSIDAALGNVLNEGSVVLQTARHILFETDVNLGNPGNLSLQAGDDINMGAFSVSMNGNLRMTANDPGARLLELDANPTLGSITSTAGGGNITTNGGDLTASGVGVTLGNINAAGGAPGGGDITITATGSNVVTGSITTNTASVGLSAQTGFITVNGNIDTRGADGFDVGNGGSFFKGTGGGAVTLSSGAAVMVNGSILTSGGDGLSVPSSQSPNDRSGGNGGNVTANASGAFVVTGTLDTSGGNGGAAGNSAADTNGGNGGTVDVSVNGTVDVGSIVSRGGHAGAGSEAANAGGAGGIISVASGGPILAGPIDVSGGDGGNSGPVGSASATGGAGGAGGDAVLVGSTIDVAGPILAGGGDGGASVNASLGGAGTPSGGDGGAGGEVRVYGLGVVQLNIGGASGDVALDVSGGAGGAGNPATSPAGDGGDGGNGGAAFVIATPDMFLSGSIDASGGAGGTGGAGTASIPAGIGGIGGRAGTIYLDASSVTDSGIGDGFIYVLAGTQFNVQGGVGGESGTSGGTTGSPGATGTFTQNADYFGTIVGLDTTLTDPPLGEEISSGVQQIVGSTGDAISFYGGGAPEEEEDRSQKEFASCKG